jgi:hypothetical protein
VCPTVGLQGAVPGASLRGASGAHAHRRRGNRTSGPHRGGLPRSPQSRRSPVGDRESGTLEPVRNAGGDRSDKLRRVATHSTPATRACLKSVLANRLQRKLRPPTSWVATGNLRAGSPAAAVVAGGRVVYHPSYLWVTQSAHRFERFALVRPGSNKLLPGATREIAGQSTWCRSGHLGESREQTVDHALQAGGPAGGPDCVPGSRTAPALLQALDGGAHATPQASRGGYQVDRPAAPCDLRAGAGCGIETTRVTSPCPEVIGPLVQGELGGVDLVGRLGRRHDIPAIGARSWARRPRVRTRLHNQIQIVHSTLSRGWPPRTWGCAHGSA